MEFKIYIYLKPWSDDRIIYKTFDAAERACRRGGVIQEWACHLGPGDARACGASDRFTLRNSWRREKHLICYNGRDASLLEFQE
jgi:hypothetical protein